MAEFGGWEMPISYPSGTIAEHVACRSSAAIFDVSHLGTVRLEGDDAFDVIQNALTNDLGKIGPGRAQYTHLLDEADASVLDDIIVWWHPDDAGRTVFDVMPNASNTDDVRGAVGGDDITEYPCRPRRAGSGGARPRGHRFSCRRRSRPVQGGAGVVERRAVHGGRHRLHGRVGDRDLRAGRGARKRCGRRSSLPASLRPAWGARHPAARSRASPARSRARSGHHVAASRARLGGGVGQAVVPRP